MTQGFIGIDLGGTNLRVAVESGDGEQRRWSEPTTSVGGAAVIEQMGRMVESAKIGVTSCVVGVPGVVASRSAPVNLRYVFNIKDFDGVDVAGDLGARLGAPVHLENDLNLAAVGEWLSLPEPRPDPFVFVGLGTGLGAGIIVGGRLLRGARGAAGEIAHLPLGDVAMTGSPDPWLEKLVSGRAVQQRMEQLRSDGAETVLGPHASLEEIHSAVETDPVAAELVELQAWNLSLGVAAMIAVIDPAMVILGGSIGRSPAIGRLCRRMVDRLTPVKVPIRATLLDDNAGLDGAIAIARDADRWL